MSTFQLFILAYIILLLLAARLIFKDFKSLKKSAYWFIYPNFLSVWSKKKWNKDFTNSFKMEFFLLVAFVLFWLSAFLYRFLMK
jgi:hypothetical protein